MPHTCERCHRELTDPESVRVGLGPVCLAKRIKNEKEPAGIVPNFEEE